MTLADYTIVAEAPDVHQHQHPEEEAWIVVERHLVIWVDGEERALGPGDYAIIGANVRHRVRALQDSRAIVVESPVRRQAPGSATADSAGASRLTWLLRSPRNGR